MRVEQKRLFKEGFKILYDNAAYERGEYGAEFARHEATYDTIRESIDAWFAANPLPALNAEERALLDKFFRDRVRLSNDKYPLRKLRSWTRWRSMSSAIDRGGSHIVQHRQEDPYLVHDLVALGFKVVYCRQTNREVEDSLGMFEGLRVKRFTSRAQNLTQRLDSIGVTGFKIAYNTAISPYATGALDKTTTLANLRSALDAKGYEELDHEDIFQQEYEEYKSPRMRGWETDVFVFTNAAFHPQLQPSRVKWWERLDLIKGYRIAENMKQEEVVRLTPMPKIAVIFSQPSERDFDTERLVHPDDVAKLGQKHTLIRRNGSTYEVRPASMRFGGGLHQGFPTPGRNTKQRIYVQVGKEMITRNGNTYNPTTPSLVVMTTKYEVAKAAFLTVPSSHWRRMINRPVEPTTLRY